MKLGALIDKYPEPDRSPLERQVDSKRWKGLET
jgi:hypothetical protein